MPTDAYAIVSNYDSTLLDEVRANGLDIERVARAIQHKLEPKIPQFVLPAKDNVTFMPRDLKSVITACYNSIPVTAKTVDLGVSAHGVAATLTVPFKVYQLIRALATAKVYGGIQRRVRDAWVIAMCTYVMSGKYEAPKFSSAPEDKTSEELRPFVEGVLELEPAK